jgi:glycosyltransferase involved in cell wall biosynthesis
MSAPATQNARVITRADFDAPDTPATSPRVALVHDWLTGMRGGEKVLEVLCQLFPAAPVYTLLHNRGSVSATIENRPIYSSLLQYLPQAAKRYRSYLPLFPLLAEMNKASDAQIVISTSHAVAKSMVKRTRRTHRSGASTPLHVCYIHTPMRYVWDLFDEYFGPERVGALASKFVFAPIAAGLRAYDRTTVGRVDLFVANSTYVAERVRRIYGREAKVLPPPVDVERYAAAVREPGENYLVVSALVPYKRVDHAVRACATLGRKLTVVGKGPETVRLHTLAAELKGSARPGFAVEFTGFASDDQLADYYRTARALLFPGVEDFGIVPVEAIACGCPVIALAEGGILDSMTEQTAVFFNEPTPEALVKAMRVYEARAQQVGEFATATLRSRAAVFSEAAFVTQFLTILNEAIEQAALVSSNSDTLLNRPGSSALQGAHQSGEPQTAQAAALSS